MSVYRSKRCILLVDLGAVFGGAEVYLENLLRILREHAICLVLCSNPTLAARLNSLGIEQINLPILAGPLKPFQLLLALCLLPYVRLRYRVDTVQINGYSEIILLPAARLLGCSAFATRHLSFDIKFEGWRRTTGRYLARFLYRHLARFANVIICVSRQVGNEAARLVPPQHVVVIPNWVRSMPPPRPAPSVLANPVRVLFVGRMLEYKGLGLLIEAIRQIKSDQAGITLEVTAVGDGDDRPDFEMQAASSGVAVEFAGFQSDVIPYYRAADIFVSPSVGPEGSPLAVLDAMAQSIPCVLSDLPVHNEVAGNGTAAFLFRSGDAGDLARALLTVIRDDDERLKRTSAAYRIIETEHHPDKAAAECLRVFGVTMGDGFPAPDRMDRLPGEV